MVSRVSALLSEGPNESRDGMWYNFPTTFYHLIRVVGPGNSGSRAASLRVRETSPVDECRSIG